MEEYLEGIEIGGSRTDEDQLWRIPRIHRVLAYAQALADIDNDEEWYKNIFSIYDHKGILTVTWKDIPVFKAKSYLQKAWVSIVTDFENEEVIFEMIEKEYSIWLKDVINRKIPVDSLNDLIIILENRNITSIDIEASNPFDEITDTLKSDFPINEINEELFKRIVAEQNVCTIVPRKFLK